MKTEHTSLPWKVNVGTTQISIRGYDNHTVCIDTNPERGREEIIANYTLICSAVNGFGDLGYKYLNEQCHTDGCQLLFTRVQRDALLVALEGTLHVFAAQIASALPLTRAELEQIAFARAAIAKAKGE